MDPSFLAAPQFRSGDEERERASLTNQEKLEAHNDLHGIVSPLPTEETIRSSIRQLHVEVEKIDVDRRANYIKAKERGAEFTSDPNDLMLFVKSERFDIAAAANRLVTYWDNRVGQFGDHRAFKNLGVATMAETPEDLYAIQMQWVTLLSRRDDYQRSIVFMNHHKKTAQYDRRSTMRLFWCVFHEGLKRDKDLPTRGQFVFLTSAVLARFDQFDRKYGKLTFQAMTMILPVRIMGFQACHWLEVMQLLKPYFRNIMGRALRQRMRDHVGTTSQILESLAHYGLSKTVVPTDLGGELLVEDYSFLGHVPNSGRHGQGQGQQEYSPRQKQAKFS